MQRHFIEKDKSDLKVNLSSNFESIIFSNSLNKCNMQDHIVVKT